MGLTPGTLHARLAPTETLPRIPDGLAVGIPADTLRQRPDVRAAERRLAAETARVGVAEAARYPSFSLSGSIGVEALTAGALDSSGAGTSSLLGGITAPIFEGGRLRSQVEIQDAVREQAEVSYEQTVLTALQDVENALVALTRNRERGAALTARGRVGPHGLAARAAALQRRPDRLPVGARHRPHRARRSRTASRGTRADGVLAVIRLYKALGGGWSPDHRLHFGRQGQSMNAPLPGHGADQRRPAEAPRRGFQRWLVAPWTLARRRPPRDRRRGILLLRSGKEAAAPSYRTEPATIGTLVVTVSATGNLQPTNQVEVGSELSGIVEAVLVDDNDRVKKGQVLARLDLSKLEDAVAKSRASLAAAEAQVLQAQATVAEARATLARFRQVAELSGGKVPSRSEMDGAEANAKRAEADEASARAGVAQARANLRSDETNLHKASIRSPIDGVVLTRKVEPGQTVAASFQAPVLFTLAEDLAKMELQVDVDEADVGQVQGRPARPPSPSTPGRAASTRR